MQSDLIPVWLGLAIFTGLSLWAMRGSPREQSREQYFTGRGMMGKWLLFFTIFSTYFSAFTVVGLPAMFYSHGIGAFWFLEIPVLIAPFVIYFVGFRIVKKAHQSPGVSSPITLLTNPYGSTILTMGVAVLTVAMLIPYLVLQISGVGKFLVGFTDGRVSYITGALICCVVTGMYLYRGGALADARTDMAQGIVMFLSAALLGVLILFASFGNSNDFAVLREKQLLSLPGPKHYFTFQTLLSYAFIFGLVTVASPQLSSKLMGAAKTEDLRSSIIIFPIAGTLMVLIAGAFGLFAAARLEVTSPDLVIGDVLRNLTAGNGASRIFLVVIASLFLCGVVAAAVSTIDSLLLSLTAICSESIAGNFAARIGKHRRWMVALLILSLVLSFNPPAFVADLAKVQSGGLMALLPCLLGPLFGIRSKIAGWTSIVCGCVPLILSKAIAMSFFGFDVGLVNLVTATLGLLIAQGVYALTRSTRSGTAIE